MQLGYFRPIDSFLTILVIIMSFSLLAIIFSNTAIDLQMVSGSNVTELQSISPISTTVNGSQAYSVAAGGGNTSFSITQFVPSQIKIRTGDSVVWHTAGSVPMPHTVTFVLDPDYYLTDILSEFNVTGSSQFIPIPPDSNSEAALKFMNETSNITAVNTRAFNPMIIDSFHDITYSISNSSYIMNGTERYLNSGTMLPNEITRPLYPNINNFTVTFMNNGTYDYFCLYHPWMTGKVIVE